MYDLRARLAQVRDARTAPRTTAAQIAAVVLQTGLLRLRSFNALEPRLGERAFLRVVGVPEERARLCSADTVSRALRKMDVATVRAMAVGILAQAERNKVFREGWHGARRYVALDGWESVQSLKRHCSGCLSRVLKLKQRDGTLREVVQYYHRYVVALLIDARVDLVLDIEPLLPEDQRADTQAARDEGELTAAYRLLRRVKQTYPWVDVVVADGLYPNGPFLTLVQELRRGAVVIARKESDEPLREARALWAQQGPAEVRDDPATHERITLWDCPGIETLDTYRGPIRLVRGQITDLRHPAAPAREWCMAVTGCATRLPARSILAAARGRWHIENTAFHQWTTQWCFGHVFTHHPQGILALYWLFFIAYNLLTLFLYRQLRSYGRDRGRDVTRTISRLIEEMHDDLARVTAPIWDTS